MSSPAPSHLRPNCIKIDRLKRRITNRAVVNDEKRVEGRSRFILRTESSKKCFLSNVPVFTTHDISSIYLPSMSWPPVRPRPTFAVFPHSLPRYHHRASKLGLSPRDLCAAMFCLISERLGMGRRGSVRGETYLDEIVSSEMFELLEDEENAKRADKFARLKEPQKM